ncbi:hypothetical protein [Rhodospirillum rubrum]|nr:hypothetical protein [Rhodospirillum rubrum]AEO48776.1 hypothetical protein F11_11560 [Rhodospirillum rubrum F11]QXG79031.1 hypothetical protein KUL73_11610 [Rhodospirillum rubrum]
MIDFKEIPNGEQWELFAQAFLRQLGFTIEIPPGRGADRGRDMAVSQLMPDQDGNQRKFVWLVSCKHNAISGASVTPMVENDVPARVRQHQANGFMGFYSTIPSQGLIDRIEGSKSPQDVQAVEFFDGARIAELLISRGMTLLMAQYMPWSLAALRPVHPTFGNLIPLLCEVCRNDLLQDSILRPGWGTILFRHDYNISQVTSVHLSCKDGCLSCKDGCNSEIESRYGGDGVIWPSAELRDYLNPAIFMMKMQEHMNQMRYIPLSFSEAAHHKYMQIFSALSQRTLRLTTQEDLVDYNSYMEIRAAFS